MLLNLQNFIKNKYFNNVKKNLFLSVVIKFFSVIFLFAIPKIILLNLDADSYGLYLTILSISMFFTFMDFGLGNNLRNKIIQLDSLKLKNEINQLISTTYLLLVFNIIFLLSIFFLIKGFINWFYFFKDSNLDSNYINNLINIFIFYVISSILLRNLNYILYAKHLSYFVDLIDVLSKLFFFIILFFIYYKNIYIDVSVLIYSHIISYLFVNLIANIFFFKKEKKYFPNYKSISFKKKKNFLKIPFQFFILQFGSLIFMYSDKIIISKLYSFQEVANFNLTGQIFIFLFTFFNFFTIPFWSTYTDSFYRGDYSWIKDSIKIQIYICILFIFIGLLIYFFSEKILNIWIGDEIKFNNILSLSWLIFIIIKCFNLIFTNFLNAVNELKIQIYLSIFVIIFNIPLSLFFANFLDLRAAGVLYGSISCLLIILFFQIYLYIKKLY